jgi:hypothetical protein
MGPQAVLALQRTAGNAAVSRILARAPGPPQPAAPEQEAAEPAPIPQSGDSKVDGKPEVEPILRSGDPEVDGKPVRVVGEDLQARDRQAHRLVPTIRGHAEHTIEQEREWDRKRGLTGKFIELFNDEDRPDPARWAKVLTEWDVVSVELTVPLSMVVTPQTINQIGHTSRLGLEHWDRTARLSSRYSDEYMRYLRGFTEAAEDAIATNRIVRDVAFAVAVTGAVVVLAPAAFAAYSGYAASAGLTGTAATVTAGGATVLTAGATGSAIEGGGGALGAIMGEAVWMLDDLLVEGREWDEAVARFDWGAVGDEGWHGLENGFVDGILALAGLRMEKALARHTGKLAGILISPQRAYAPVLGSALQHALAGGATGSVIGALDAGLKAALRGGDRDAIVAAMKLGFAVGGVGGTLLGAGGGALQGRAQTQAVDDAFTRLEAGEIPQERGLEKFRAAFLGAGEEPRAVTLEHGRFVNVGGDAIPDGTTTGFLLRDTRTGRLLFFKPRTTTPHGEMLAAGITPRSYSRREVAGSIAARELGIETPGLELVNWEGRIGTVQPWIDGAQTLKQIYFQDEGLYNVIVGSPEYQRLDAAVSGFQYLIQNLDRNEGNLFVRLGPDGRLMRLDPLDFERTFPPVPERAILVTGPRSGAAPLPEKYTRAAYRHFQEMDRDRVHLEIALRGLLPEEEVGHALRRLTALLEDVRRKLRTVGEAGTFVD